MFSRVSDLKIFMTAWLSTPCTSATRPISFANATLSACQALSENLTISATEIDVRVTSSAKVAYTDRAVSNDRSSSAPTTLFGGDRKSATAVPSRKNSGEKATPKPSGQLLPELRSSSGMISVATVPGGTVEVMSTRRQPSSRAIAPPISATTLSTSCRWTSPLRPDGVPTHTSTTSASATAPAMSLVARSRPASTLPRTISSRRISVTGLMP